MNDEQSRAVQQAPTPAPTPAPDTATAPSSAPSPGVAAGTGPTVNFRRAKRSLVQPGLVIAWLVASVALTVSLLLWQKLSSMQEQLARQSAEAGSRAVEARTLARQAEETVRETAAKVAIIDTRIGDLMAYRAQLDDVMQSVARSRDENLVVDLEAAVSVAQDQTQLTGRVEPLMAALRTAERRLARSGDPRLASVARAVAKDLERVKAASIPDAAGMLVRLDQLLRQVDDLPTANDVGHIRLERAVREVAPGPADSWWARVGQSMWEEGRKLLRVSRVERPDASMMNPEQVFFLRENLKLRLQGARLAILARQYEAARSDLAAAQTALGAYFDPASRKTQAAATLLQQIQASAKSADLPRVDETLLALGSAAAAANLPTGLK